MPTLTVTKSYANAAILNETDLDNIKNALETFINVTKLDSTNIQSDTVGLGLTSTGANAIATSMNSASSLGILQKASSTEGYRLLGNSTSTATALGPNYVESSAITLSGGTASSATDITGATITITARNRPILLLLQSTSIDKASSAGAVAQNGSSSSSSIYLVKDASTLEKVPVNSPTSSQYLPLSSISFIDVSPGTGSKVYKLQYIAHSGSLTLNDAVFVALEL